MYRLGLLILLLGLAGPAYAETIRVGGLGAATKLLPVLFSGRGQQDDTRLKVIPSLGSSGGLRALSADALDMAISGRPLNSDELKQGMKVAAAIRTPFVLVTSHPKPNELKSTDIAAIFRAPRANWADGSLIRVIIRPKSDSDTPLLGAMFPGMVSAIEAARGRPDIAIAATDQDNLDAAARIDGSLAGSTLTQVKIELRNLRLIAIDRVAPSLKGLESGAYPFSKTIYFVLPAKAKPDAERLVSFIRSPAARDLLRETDNLIVPDPGVL
jgi:phosphate transport system substrate-binding protein